MREQAASTRGVSLRPARKLTSAARSRNAHATAKPAQTTARVAARSYSPLKAKGAVKRTVHHPAASPKLGVMPVEAASFAAEEPVAKAVPISNPVDQMLTPAFAAETPQTARQVITEAFDAIDRNEVVSSSLQGAAEPARVDQDGGSSLLQRIWSTLSGTMTNFSTADR